MNTAGETTEQLPPNVSSNGLEPGFRTTDAAEFLTRLSAPPDTAIPVGQRSIAPLAPKALRPALSVPAGAACGVAAAVLYTLANIALRGSVAVDPFLVSAMKAAPTVIFLTPVLVWMRYRQQTIATSWRMLPLFAIAALIAQVGGNATFQVALGIIGLAASVPIALGVMIIGGAVLGRFLLGEPVRGRTFVAMVTLIIAVAVLSWSDSSHPVAATSSTAPIWLGGLCAAISGAAYALFGAMMRRTLNSGISGPATMLVSGIIGTITLWSITMSRLSTSALADVTFDQWTTMMLAGVFNFSAFVALSFALRALPVVAVNLINASQVAMAAIAGVLLFAEPLSFPLVLGLMLTMSGLLVMASRRRPRQTQPPDAAETVRPG